MPGPSPAQVRRGHYHSSSTFKLAAARSGQPGLASRKSTWQGGSGRTSRPPTARPAGKPPRPGIRPGDHDGTRAHCRHCPRASRACQCPPCLPPWQRWQIKGHIERSPEPGLGTSGAYKLAHVHVTPARRIGEVDLSQPPCDAVIPTSTAVAALRLADVGSFSSVYHAACDTTDHRHHRHERIQERSTPLGPAVPPPGFRTESRSEQVRPRNWRICAGTRPSELRRDCARKLKPATSSLRHAKGTVRQRQPGAAPLSTHIGVAEAMHPTAQIVSDGSPNMDRVWL
jgi:hypothetical protein